MIEADELDLLRLWRHVIRVTVKDIKAGCHRSGGGYCGLATARQWLDTEQADIVFHVLKHPHMRVKLIAYLDAAGLCSHYYRKRRLTGLYHAQR